uniref:EF-hand domain-containing protein n=1 Tax=Haptolina brevifila TaxID=156173 RepID=A0A7S2DK39_9EUKA|mmetsp:Transcript_39882/g.79797  ORF Transcript_39882/g.79797 Transcript_39882/m.79797 type:complete len:349 (+) Transcript_39882:71-1117(+)
MQDSGSMLATSSKQLVVRKDCELESALVSKVIEPGTGLVVLETKELAGGTIMRGKVALHKSPAAALGWVTLRNKGNFCVSYTDAVDTHGTSTTDASPLSSQSTSVPQAVRPDTRTKLGELSKRHSPGTSSHRPVQVNKGSAAPSHLAAMVRTERKGRAPPQTNMSETQLKAMAARQEAVRKRAAATEEGKAAKQQAVVGDTEIYMTTRKLPYHTTKETSSRQLGTLDGFFRVVIRQKVNGRVQVAKPGDSNVLGWIDERCYNQATLLPVKENVVVSEKPRSRMALAAKLNEGIDKLIQTKGMTPAQIFERWDTDRSGMIERHEFRKACKELKIEGATEKAIDALFDQV